MLSFLCQGLLGAKDTEMRKIISFSRELTGERKNLTPNKILKYSEYMLQGKVSLGWKNGKEYWLTLSKQANKKSWGKEEERVRVRVSMFLILRRKTLEDSSKLRKL